VCSSDLMISDMIISLSRRFDEFSIISKVIFIPFLEVSSMLESCCLRYKLCFKHLNISYLVIILKVNTVLKRKEHNKFHKDADRPIHTQASSTYNYETIKQSC
jgi:hypothetical protein